MATLLHSHPLPPPHHHGIDLLRQNSSSRLRSPVRANHATSSLESARSTPVSFPFQQYHPSPSPPRIAFPGEHGRKWSLDGDMPIPSRTGAGSGLFSVFAPIFHAVYSLLSRPPPLPHTAPVRTAPSRLQSLSRSLPKLTSPDMAQFIALCALWYSASALSNNTAKAVLNQFPFPVTLTIVQFAFVSGYCFLCASDVAGKIGCRMTRLRTPTVKIVRNTAPMAAFQVAGHVFSSMAISRVPVSTVHTIKALSPLFTVLSYAAFFGVRYSPRTYFALLPLTFGVMLATSREFRSGSSLGFLFALGSTLIFVAQNIVSKKLLPSEDKSKKSGLAATPSEGGKLDKLNLLFFSSGMALLLMVPIWIWSDLGSLLSTPLVPPSANIVTFPVKGGGVSNPSLHPHHDPTPSHRHVGAILGLLLVNGTVHFGQNLLAFQILSLVSPVTYSIASLIKRIAVICAAIIWFAQPVHFSQGIGITMTFIGLYLYNQSKSDVSRGEKQMRAHERRQSLVLPSTLDDQRALEGRVSPAPGGAAGYGSGSGNGYAFGGEKAGYGNGMGASSPAGFGFSLGLGRGLSGHSPSPGAAPAPGSYAFTHSVQPHPSSFIAGSTFPSRVTQQSSPPQPLPVSSSPPSRTAGSKRPGGANMNGAAIADPTRSYPSPPASSRSGSDEMLRMR